MCRFFFGGWDCRGSIFWVHAGQVVFFRRWQKGKSGRCVKALVDMDEKCEGLQGVLERDHETGDIWANSPYLGGGFKDYGICTPILWGNDPIWLRLFKSVVKDHQLKVCINLALSSEDHWIGYDSLCQCGHVDVETTETLMEPEQNQQDNSFSNLTCKTIINHQSSKIINRF